MGKTDGRDDSLSFMTQVFDLEKGSCFPEKGREILEL